MTPTPLRYRAHGSAMLARWRSLASRPGGNKARQYAIGRALKEARWAYTAAARVVLVERDRASAFVPPADRAMYDPAYRMEPPREAS